MTAKITRTVFKRKATLTWFNENTREVTDTETEIYEEINEAEFMKRMSRNGKNVDCNYGRLISVRISTEAEELLASMTLDEFCKNATMKPVIKKEANN